MTDYPIIFSGPMVRALLDGRKTMTRRLAWRPAKPGEKAGEGSRLTYTKDAPDSIVGEIIAHQRPSPWRKVRPGDRLWVRENFSGEHCWSGIPPSGWGWDAMRRPTEFWYWADGNIPTHGDWTRPIPSIHMPRWASRLTLTITATRVERLRNLSEADALAEGIEATGFWRDDHPASICFSVLWDSLHGNEAWNSDPEVVALTFRVIRANIDAPEALAA